MVGGFWIAALAQSGQKRQARLELVKLAQACARGNWSFTEWFHGKTLAPRGMAGQSWNAAGYLLAAAAAGEPMAVGVAANKLLGPRIRSTQAVTTQWLADTVKNRKPAKFNSKFGSAQQGVLLLVEDI